ncbi:phage tail protein, partial [Chishuiella changwenlii]|uniref:phage tail protein n=1 Tax=Chishuiella changwenlii TaxID=1434701 RepID=UPI002FD87F83
MYYNIKRNNEIIASVVPTGTYDAKIMGDELVNMNFTLSEPIDFLIGDMVEVYGQLFILNVAPTEEKKSSIQYNYTLQFESIKYELAKVQLLFPDTNNNLNITDFSIMGDARLTLELIVQNANRVQNGWKLGTVDETETKNISYSANNLLTALTTLADEFKNEFWIDQDKTIHFTTRKEFSGLTLEYGKSKGLRSLMRTTIDASNIVTRLYAVGSTKNIIAEDGNWSNRLMMDVPYLEINTDKYGIIEHTEILDDVFPNRKGKVTAVNASNFLQFSDNTLEFDLNSSDVLIPGTTVKVTFNTGQLAGYTFEVKEFGFNNQTKTFELQPNQEEKAITVPSELMRPAVGDEYVLTDIVMPSQYKTEAQAELKQRANEYLIANCDPRLQYSAVSDLFYFEEQNIKIKLGQTVRMIDAAFKLEADIRVIGLSQDLQDEYNVQIELADGVQISRITRAYLDDRKWENQIIKHQQQVDRNVRRNYQFSREIQENIFDTDGYFDADKIKPLSIETKMLTVGARSQQYTVKDSQVTIINNSTIQTTIGQLIHFTIDDTTERIWNILAGQINNISPLFNYIYLRCQRNGSNANFIVTTEQLRFDSDANFYHFEYGYLSSVTDGFRKIKTSYGFSNINGGEITTGKILGQNGQTFIDIDNRKIYGSVEFLPDSPAFEQINNSIIVGGRNLIRNSNFINGSEFWTVVNSTISVVSDTQFKNALKVISNTITSGTFNNYLNLINNEYYMYSIWLKADSNMEAYIGFDGSGISRAKKVQLTNQWQYFTMNEIFTSNAAFRIYGIGTFYIANCKLEKGTKATDWTPAPEDMQQQIDSIEIGGRNLIQQTEFKLTDKWIYNASNVGGTVNFVPSQRRIW